MCAIAGILNLNGNRPVDRDLLLRMRDSMIHRGPDDSGAYFDGPVGLASRRLSIIDLQTGNQPIHNEDQTVWVVMNGEIYNFQSVRKDLECRGHHFYTNSDTEVLVHAYEEFGQNFLSVIDGMFGLALWDSREQTLLLARDRMGEKPLHYWAGQNEFIFGSELKALLQHPAVPRDTDPHALSAFLSLQYVPAPRTIFKGVHKLLPGHMLTVSARGNHELVQRQYWDIPMPVEPDKLPPVDAVGEELLGLLRKSVKAQLISNVPVGVLMSGGIDSTLVATLAAEEQPGIQTFTMAFEEPSYDESHLARLVAQRIGCKHHIEVCRADSMVEMLPKIIGILDEPFADASILPTYLLSRFTAKSVKVALGGDGGDELFAGYPTFQALRVRSVFRALPQVLRNAIKSGAAALPRSHHYLSFDFRANHFLRAVDADTVPDFFTLMGAFTEAEKRSLLVGPSIPYEFPATGHFDDDVQRCLYLCAKLYLPDGVLVKGDRASMAHSLEVRAPFLSREMVEFAARCPLEYKMTPTQTKWILRHAARSLLPPEVLWAKKRGFGAPVGKWIMGSLKDFFRDYLHPDRLSREGIFDPGWVTQLLEKHIAGKQNNARTLWTLLVFELWKERMAI